MAKQNNFINNIIKEFETKTNVFEELNEYSFYIGLVTNQGDNLNYEHVKDLIKEEFKKIGIIGHNEIFLNGVWQGVEEDCLKISFVNSFNVEENVLLLLRNVLKREFKQDSILVIKQKVEASF